MKVQKTSVAGFTIVELVIVIAVISILLTLVVVNVLNTRVAGRDTERREEAQAIARHFESIYSEATTGGETFASYPGTNQATAASGAIREGIDRNTFFSPSATVTTNYSNLSLVGATNTVETVTGVQPQPSTSDTYVYQPFKADGALCQDTAPNPDECVRFNLYYWHEASNTVKKITSRNQ